MAGATGDSPYPNRTVMIEGYTAGRQQNRRIEVIISNPPAVAEVTSNAN